MKSLLLSTLVVLFLVSCNTDNRSENMKKYGMEDPSSVKLEDVSSILGFELGMDKSAFFIRVDELTESGVIRKKTDVKLGEHTYFDFSPESSESLSAILDHADFDKDSRLVSIQCRILLGFSTELANRIRGGYLEATAQDRRDIRTLIREGKRTIFAVIEDEFADTGYESDETIFDNDEISSRRYFVGGKAIRLYLEEEQELVDLILRFGADDFGRILGYLDYTEEYHMIVRGKYDRHEF